MRLNGTSRAGIRATGAVEIRKYLAGEGIDLTIGQEIVIAQIIGCVLDIEDPPPDGTTTARHNHLLSWRRRAADTIGCPQGGKHG